MVISINWYNQWQKLLSCSSVIDQVPNDLMRLFLNIKKFFTVSLCSWRKIKIDPVWLLYIVTNLLVLLWNTMFFPTCLLRLRFYWAELISIRSFFWYSISTEGINRDNRLWVISVSTYIWINVQVLCYPWGNTCNIPHTIAHSSGNVHSSDSPFKTVN